jgi:hypothetical protein
LTATFSVRHCPNCRQATNTPRTIARFLSHSVTGATQAKSEQMF